MSPPTATRFRVAYHPDDLPCARWRSISRRFEAIPWLVSGHQTFYPLEVYAEVEHSSTPGEIIRCLQKHHAAGVPDLPKVSTPSGHILLATCNSEPGPCITMRTLCLTQLMETMFSRCCITLMAMRGLHIGHGESTRYNPDAYVVQRFCQQKLRRSHSVRREARALSSPPSVHDR